MQTLIETLQLFKQDIANVDSSNGPCDPLSSYEKDMVALERDFFTITINQSPQIQACIQELLTCLNIPDYQKGRFTDASITVHEFLVELSRLNNSKEIERIKEYIQFIDEKMAINWRKILLAGLVLLTAVEFGLPFFGAFGGFSFVEGIVTAALFIPVVGIVAGIGITIYTIYQKITERNITVLDRVRDIAFIILGSALSLTAHGLSAGAVAIASPVLGALYVLGNGIHIINESIRFF